MGKKNRIYWRNGRAWADFRDYADVGGKREPLRPPGQSRATTDPDVAAALLAARLAELEALRRGRVLGTKNVPTLAEYARRYLIKRAESGRVSEAWLEAIEKRLEEAIRFFGADRRLDDIRPPDVADWAGELAKAPGRRVDPNNPTRRLPRSGGTIRHYLNALSGLYTRAVSEGIVMQNPVAAMIDKPRGSTEEAAFLSVPDAALLLEAARTYRPKRSDMVAVPHLYEILATFLLTGGRKREVLGLAPEDISFERGVVMFRPHPWRSLKTKGSRRNVPLWPQLAEILGPYMSRTDRAPGRLLFPSHRTGGMIHDLRRPLAVIAKRAGLDPEEVHLHTLRHTYCAARLQTLDHGAPVSVFTVARELGHTSTALVERIYGHVAGVRHRSEVVEYRVEQHADVLGDRLRSVRALAAVGG